MRMPSIVLLVATLGALPAPAQEPAASPVRPVAVALELGQEFFYEESPLSVRISVRNTGAGEVSNPIRTPLFGGFKVTTADGRALARSEAGAPPEPSRPERLAAGSFYGGVVDLARLFPGLSRAGSYRIHWSGDGLVSEMLLVRVIPRYDPKRRYAARIETNRGAIELIFHQDRAPVAVKAFIDLANSGFYDGLPIHEARADAYISGGDGRAVSPPREAFLYPAEQSALPIVAGTVAMRPVSAAPPANGSAFVIFLAPQPAWTGQVTVVGQVVSGLDVVQKLSRVPTTGRGSQPFFKPLEEIVIERVTVERAAEAASGTGG